MDAHEKDIYSTVTSPSLTYEQKLETLANQAEDELNFLEIPEKTRHYFQTGAINDLFEGHAPYRPRYIRPDYEKYLKEGSKFLRVGPAKNIEETIFHLRMIYHHVPSITSLFILVPLMNCSSLVAKDYPTKKSKRS